MLDLNEVGVMLYYGDSSLPPLPNVSNEVKYKPYLLQHVILGLKMLQDKGHMVLKLREIETQFTAEVLFILKVIFESVLIYRPFTLSPLSSSSFVVCKFLSQQNSKTILPGLEKVFEHVTSRLE